MIVNQNAIQRLDLRRQQLNRLLLPKSTSLKGATHQICLMPSRQHCESMKQHRSNFPTSRTNLNDVSRQLMKKFWHR